MSRLKSKERFIFAKNAMLNKAGYNSTAAIAAKIEKWGKGEPEIDLQISDCLRSINFEFSLHDEGDRENTLYKIDTMLEVLMDFRDAVEAEIPAAERRERKRDAEK